MIVAIPAIESNKDMGGVEAGLFSNKTGWYPDEAIENGDKTFIGTTYLIHFLYTQNGQTTDRYYPCKPENLVWNYYSITNAAI